MFHTMPPEDKLPQPVKRDFPDREAVILWIITNQMSRRNLTPFQRSELALRLKPKLTQEGLKGNALVVYAIVYDAGEYSGGYRYLADFTGMEINSLIRLVGSMVKQGYLKKEVEEIKNTKIPHLRAVRREK